MTMQYRKPEIVVQTNSLNAVQSGTQKKTTPSDNAQGSMIQPTVSAYEADE